MPEQPKFINFTYTIYDQPENLLKLAKLTTDSTFKNNLNSLVKLYAKDEKFRNMIVSLVANWTPTAKWVVVDRTPSTKGSFTLHET